jgi:threonine dehydratase
MPDGASPMKVAATRALGAEVVLHGDINAAMARLDQILADENRVLVHPFNDRRVMAGQGTVGIEIAEALPEVAQVLCPVGGGGLISGLAIALKHLRPQVRVVGLEPTRAATLRRAWDAGGPVRLPRVDTLAASLGASLAGELTYAASRACVDDILTLSEEDIAAAVRETFARCKLFAEPGAVLGVAALLRGLVEPAGGPVVIVITGGNMDLELAASLLRGGDAG